MLYENKILIGKADDQPVFLYPEMLCRHGLISGATGTGKTTTLKVFTESLSDLGVPVFLADVKGDLGGFMQPGGNNEKAQARVEALGLLEEGFRYHRFPVNFWDVFAESGMPLRTTVSELGPLLLSRVLDLTDTQTDILTIIFKIADDEGLLLIDIKDLKSMIQYVSECRKEYTAMYGNMSPQSLAAILRAVVALETEGAETFIGEPAVSIRDWLTVTEEGRGTIQLLDCRKLFLKPRMYAMFLLWLMSELYETLPEAGDLEKPKMVFFFDEAHLLFDNAPRLLREKIEQVVKLIRSKGVGVYFITQSPSDIPGEVLAQLGNKIQHALHAYTPAEQKKLKAAAMALRENPALDTLSVLQELGTGEALISVLDSQGVPTMVERAMILPPESLMGSISEEDRMAHVESSILYGKYRDGIDRDSAFEFLERRRIQIAEDERLRAEQAAEDAEEERDRKDREKQQSAAMRRASSQAKQAAKTVTGTVGREIGKSVGGKLAGSFGKRLGGNLGAVLGRGLIGTFFGN